jgi:GAF domain-containing protein
MPSADALLDELARLADSLGPVVEPPATARLLKSLAATARALFGAAACSVALLSEDEEELVYTSAAGAGEDDVTGMRMPSGRGVAGWVVASGQPIAINDLRTDPRFARDVAESTGYVPQAIVAVPIVSEQRMLGVLTLLDRDTTRSGARDDLQNLALFADQAAIAVQAAAAFASTGRILLGALAAAAGTGTPLAEALDDATRRHTRASRDAVGNDDGPGTELAALLARLHRDDPAELALLVRLAREVLAYTRDRGSTSGLGG